MGGSYGSIHVHSGDTERVRRAGEHVAQRSGICFLITGPTQGWITLFPSGAGHDPTISKRLAARLKDTDSVLHLLVHDDDVFMFWHYQNGRLRDEFNAHPDYFGKVSSRARAKTSGRPELLAPLLADGANVEQLAAALQQTTEAQIVGTLGLADGVARLERLASLLKLPHVPGSYEAILSGELPPGIASADELTHIPAEHSPAHRRLKDQAFFQGLADSGLLTAEIPLPGEGEVPIWASDPSDGSILLGWTNLDRMHGSTRVEPLMRWRAPWTEPEPSSLEVPSKAHAMAVTPSGRLILVATAYGDPGVLVLDAHTGEPRGKYRTKEPPNGFLFTTDESRAYVLTSTQVLEVDLGGVSARAPELLAPLIVERSGILALAISPDGSRLVLCTHGGIQVFRLDGSGPLHTIGIGPRPIPPHVPTVFAEHLRRERSFRGHFGNSAELPTGLCFTADGETLVCTTEGSILSFRWPEILDAGTDPSPVRAFDAMPLKTAGHGQLAGVHAGRLYCPFLLPSSRTVITGGYASAIYGLDLDTGTGRVLLELPGDYIVDGIFVPPDRRFLVTSLRREATLGGGMSMEPSPLRIWNLPALLARSGTN